jgi:hypothetical protein
MNTNGLAKHYGLLSPRERLPLIVAAADRGDDAEADRLAHSAGRVCHELVDYHGLGEGLLFLQFLHVNQLLQRTLTLSTAWGLLGKSPPPGQEEGPAVKLTGLERVRLQAYLLRVQADAWKRFCGELRIDPEAQLRDVPGYDAIKPYLEAVAALTSPDALTPEEATALLRKMGGDANAQAPTVEEEAEWLHHGLDGFERRWQRTVAGPAPAKSR